MSLTSGVSFSLLKISLATDPADAKTFSWMHETRDVRVLFDNYGAVTAHFNMFSIFTVFQDDAILVRRVKHVQMVNFIIDLASAAKLNLRNASIWP